MSYASILHINLNIAVNVLYPFYAISRIVLFRDIADDVSITGFNSRAILPHILLLRARHEILITSVIPFLPALPLSNYATIY